MVRIGQPPQGRGAQRGPDRRAARPAASEEGGVSVEVRLDPLTADTDHEALTALFAEGLDDPEQARQVAEQTLALLRGDPRPDPWVSYVARDEGQVVGVCSFKAGLDESGAVEIAYFTFPRFERRGFATAMAAALLVTAQGGGARLVRAHTLPEINASTMALARNEFTLIGEIADPDDGLIWRWERPIGA
ncbi:MAG: GNAT family N-acetyltransferase [Sphingomonadaceae bacterium]|nr:GNAT family N-acetyltransferase [Sphingomonadaceae bacterium]